MRPLRIALFCAVGVVAVAANAAKTWDVAVGPPGFLVFSPATLVIASGDTVRWTWGSSFHTVTSDTGDFNSPGAFQNIGYVYSFRFTTAGDYPYHCAIHGLPNGFGMAGLI